MSLVLDNLLIQASDFTNFRDISINTDTDRLNAFIRESQMREIRAFLGDALYFQLITDYTPDPPNEGTFSEARFTSLWFGDSWVKNGFTIQFNGLKAAHVMYAYERFLYNNKMNVTRYGSRILADNDLSENFTPQKKYEVSADSMGLMYQADADEYIRGNTSLFPEFDNPDIKAKKETGWEFMKIGTTIGR